MNSQVSALAVSGTDLYAGGSFSTAGGTTAKYIAKWDGSAWSGLGSGMNGLVRALAVSGTDLYAGGQFTTAGGNAAYKIAKWDGSAWSALGSGMQEEVSALAVSASDLCAGGGFTAAGGQVSMYVARADISENPQVKPLITSQPVNQTVAATSTVNCFVTAIGPGPLAYQWRKDGSVVVDFGRVSGATTPHLAILNVQSNDAGNYGVVVSNAYGSVTSTPAVLTVVPVSALGWALDATELIWSTGGDVPWTAQTAVTHDGVDAAQSGTILNNQETWVETSVIGPGWLSFWWKVSSESRYDYLEFYINGSRQATRISGEVDWQVQNYTLAAGAQVLRWTYIKDNFDSSGQDRGWVDQVNFTPHTGPPTLVQQPARQTVGAGGTATFRVQAVSALPFGFQWRKNGTNLIDGQKISGVTLPTLTLSSLFGADAGNYSVVITNASGSVTSTVAMLTVIDPLITVAPASQNREPGQRVEFSVTVTGTAPIAYQWQFDGTNIADVHPDRAGTYSVLVTNTFGSPSSSAVLLCPGQSGFPRGTPVAMAMAGDYALVVSSA
jgi:hypothetical protein